MGSIFFSRVAFNCPLNSSNPSFFPDKKTQGMVKMLFTTKASTFLAIKAAGISCKTLKKPKISQCIHVRMLTWIAEAIEMHIS